MTNHSEVIGPNSAPTEPVPRFWIQNSATMISTVAGTTNGCSIGVITSSPSTAESTEIAGVIIASPKNIAAPKMPRPTSHQRSRPWRSVPRETSAVSARMPPSPLLSARMISTTYLSVTTITSAQNTRDRRP